MVSFALVQSKANYGLGKVATLIGNPCSWYRSGSASNPTAIGNKRGTIAALFDSTDDVEFRHPSRYGKPDWYGCFDATNTLAGDYLIGPQGTFYIASQAPAEAFKPIHCIWCSHTFNVLRDPGVTTIGIGAYGGVQRGPGHQTTLMTGWPGALLSRRIRTGDVKLPRDVELATWEILIPLWPAVEIVTHDTIEDENGRYYHVDSAELTPLGWRLHVVETMT